MFGVTLLRQIRVHQFAPGPTYSHPTISRFGNFDFVQSSWINFNKSQKVLFTVPRSSSHRAFDFRSFRQYATQNLRSNSGLCRLTTGKMVAYALIGSISLWPMKGYCATNGPYMTSAYYPRTISSEASRSEENRRRAFLLIKKLLVPVVLFLNVWWNWGQVHPVFLAAKVVLVFLSTKPVPSSVHIFVDQLLHQIMNQQPFAYIYKPLQVKAVEVEDYTIMCLARVEIKDERLVLVGVLGSWWILPLLSSSKEFFFYDKSSWTGLITLVKNRFRLLAD